MTIENESSNMKIKSNNKLDVISSINNEIIRFNNEKQILMNFIYSYITDGAIPLQERWEFFETIPNEFLLTSIFYIEYDFLNKNNISYDDLLIDRRELVDTKELPLNVEDYIEKEFSEDEMNGFKEEILSKGYGTFEYDW